MGVEIMLKKIIYSVMAGIAIAMGATIYVLCSNKIVGAFMFSIGILLVMEFKLLLFTGYVPTQRSGQKITDYLINSTLIFFGNLLGAGIVAGLLALTRLRETIYNTTVAICEVKVNDNLLSTFILSIFCGFIIAGIIKASNLKKSVLYVAMMIATFILCGFDHIVANAFYFSASLTLFTWSGLLFMLVCMLGNFVGGLLCSYIPTPEEKK
jgi:formate/nitrite transporter FocA (FNT family)